MDGSFTPEDALGVLALGIVLFGFVSGAVYVLYHAGFSVRVPQLMAEGLTEQQAQERYSEEFGRAIAAIDLSAGFGMPIPPPNVFVAALPADGPKVIALPTPVQRDAKRRFVFPNAR